MKIKLTGAVVLALFAVQNVPAVDWHWDNGGGDGLWSTAANWDNADTVPGSTADGVFITASPVTVSILAGDSLSPGSATPFGSVFPEFGTDLDIYGTLVLKWYLHPVALPGNSTIINMFGNSSLTGEGIGLGYNWFYNGAPNVTMNLYGNSSVGINFFFWGGHLNLYGGTFATGGVADGNSDQVSDATRLMNIAGGKLVLTGDATATVNGWITRGILEGNGILGNVNIDTVSTPGFTIVTAIPEPTSLALLGFGGVVGMLLRRRRA